MIKKERLLTLLITLGLINTTVKAANYTTPFLGNNIFLTGADTVDVSGTSYAISVTTGGVGLKITGAPLIKYTSSTVNTGSGIRGAAGTALAGADMGDRGRHCRTQGQPRRALYHQGAGAYQEKSGGQAAKAARRRPQGRCCDL